MNYVDLFIGGVLMISVFQGYRKGIIFSIIKIVSYVVGLGVSIYYYPTFSKWLDDKLNLVEQVANFIYGILPLPRTVMTTNMDGLNTSDLTEIVTSLPLPDFYQQQMLTYLDNYQVMLTGSILSIGETITLVLANTLVEVTAFSLLLVGTVIIVRRLGRLMSWQANKSFFGGVNRLAGAFLGLATGLLVTVISLGLLVPVVVLGEVVQIQGLTTVAQQVNSSLLVPVFLSLFTLFQSSAGGVLPFASGIFNIN